MPNSDNSLCMVHQLLSTLPWNPFDITKRNLLRVNYNDPVEKFLCLSKELSNFPFPWASRIAQSKMFLLPHILNVFHTIPLPFLPSQLRKLQGLINAFVWQHKRPRLKRSILLTPVQQGGMGAPNIQAYYRAVLLDQLREWWSTNSPKSGNRLNPQFWTLTWAFYLTPSILTLNQNINF